MRSHFAVILLLALTAFTSVLAQPPAALDIEINVPVPPGSGTVTFQLTADPQDANILNLDHYEIVSIAGILHGSLQLFDDTTGTCTGGALNAASTVSTTASVCFISDTSSVAEFQSSFTYSAADNTNALGTAGTVTLLNYDLQSCPGIPDLGSSGSFSAPPPPSVDITLNGLEVQFDVNLTYIRNDTIWFIDFWPFNAAANQDSADGTGRTCSNLVAANFVAPFRYWFNSAPRATYDATVDASISPALNDNVYPAYDPSGGEWTLTDINCANVNFQSSLPLSKLIFNTGSGCSYTQSANPAAVASGLIFNGILFVGTLTPRLLSDSTAGYLTTSWEYGFSFQIQNTVSDLSAISQEFNFQVFVLRLVVTPGTGLVLELETRTQDPNKVVDSPDMNAFALASGYPNQAAHVSAGTPPTLTLLSTGAACGTTKAVCVMTWTMEMPELTLAEAGSSSLFNTQYAGVYDFTWKTVGTTPIANLAADLTISASATDPSFNLSTVPLASTLEFFSTEADMLDTSANDSVTVFNSGDDVWVRHTLIPDPSDTAAFTFTLSEAFCCFSNVPGFIPTLALGGCSADIPGVMEASLGQRYVLFNGTGIANTQFLNWDWVQVLPLDPSWPGGQTVNNGFGISALPLVVDGITRTWYFHLISIVTQSGSFGRRSEVVTYKHQSVSEHSMPTRQQKRAQLDLSNVKIKAQKTQSSSASLPQSWLSPLLA